MKATLCFLRGENSNYIEPHDEPDIKKQFPKATITTVPEAGHWLHAENPRFFAQQVAAFLEVS